MLRRAGVPCEGRAPGVDEDAIEAATPEALAAARARAKARAAHVPGEITVGADQVAHMDGASFGKPRSVEDHLARLKHLRGNTHTLTTAVCIVGPDGNETLLEESTRLQFRGDMTDADLEAYVATGEGSACAGGYAAEGRGAALVERIDGDFFNVIGLPLYRVLPVLRALGWTPFVTGTGA